MKELGNMARPPSSAESEHTPLLLPHGSASNVGGRDEEDEKLESLDYDRLENSLYRRKFRELAEIHNHSSMFYDSLRWFLMVAVGLGVGIIGFTVDYVSKYLLKWKFKALDESISHCNEDGCVELSMLFYTLVSVGYTAVAALFVIYAPASGGSGIPEIKAYLNGIKIPHIFRFKTLVGKWLGTFFSVSSGLIIGKEGPMIHLGAIVGAGLPQLKSTSLPWINFGFDYFRNDRAKRDFVAAGVAAGIGAAFGAPIGGVLLSLEEGASFWNQWLTWRMLFCSMAAAFFLNLLVSGVEMNTWSNLSSPGLVNFGVFPAEYLWNVFDLLIFILIGAFGGLSGALFNYLFIKLSQLRARFVTKNKWKRFGEVLLVCMLTVVINFLAAQYAGSCKLIVTTNNTNISKDIKYRAMFCKEGEFNDVATLTFNSLEDNIITMFHVDGLFSLSSLAIVTFLYFVFCCLALGTAVPAGLIMPCLAIGAVYGRFVAHVMHDVFPHHTTYLGTYALIGSASFLGGVSRMTISLTVIMIETTNEVAYGLPLILTIMASRIVGDLFNEGIYEIALDVKGIPFLNFHPPRKMKQLLARDIMATAPICIWEHEKVGDIVELLREYPHNCFPVVRPLPDPPASLRVGPLLASEGLPPHISSGKNNSDANNSSNHLPVTKIPNGSGGSDAVFSNSLTSSSLTRRVSSRLAVPINEDVGQGVTPQQSPPSHPIDDTLSASDIDPSLYVASEMVNSLSRGEKKGTNARSDHGREGSRLMSRASMFESAAPQSVVGQRNGQFCGVMLRSQIIIMLRKRAFGPLQGGDVEAQKLTYQDFTNFYPYRDMSVDRIHFNGSETEQYLDFSPYMNPTPYTVTPDCPLVRVFNLFRTMGLRHLVVLSPFSEVVGVISRKDLAEVAHGNHAVPSLNSSASRH